MYVDKLSLFTLRIYVAAFPSILLEIFNLHYYAQQIEYLW